VSDVDAVGRPPPDTPNGAECAAPEMANERALNRVRPSARLNALNRVNNLNFYGEVSAVQGSECQWPWMPPNLRRI